MIARLRFGTAGIRAPLGPGSDQMNRDNVRRVAAALAQWLMQASDGIAPVVVAHDARRCSDVFARDAAAVLTGAGLPVVRFPGPVPTPLAAFAVRRLAARAALVVTASHNPATDNGLKVFWGDGGQVVPPHSSGGSCSATRRR